MKVQFEVDDASVHLWAFVIEPTESIALRLRSLLSEEDILRADHFKFVHLRDTYTICRGLVRTLLGRYLGIEPVGIEFHYQTKGKPVVVNHKQLEFNVSHAAGMMLCAITRGREVGVDVERVRLLPDMQELARQFFCAEEANELMSLPEEQQRLAFYRCWTRKEAYLKALGQGLSAPLHSFRVTFTPTAEARLIHIRGDKDVARSWKLSAVELGDPYVAALAYFGPERGVRLTSNIDPRDFLAESATRS
jgi:4'-phosphopantetheinyl transferase